jgi:hypothetical protein
MKKALLAFVLALTVSGAAIAGVKYTTPVTINDTSRVAYGAMGTARNSTDSDQYIGCQVIATTSGSTSYTCSARSAAGVFRSCAGGNIASMVQAAASTTTDSYIYFSWDASGVCNYLVVTNYSTYEPKK